MRFSLVLFSAVAAVLLAALPAALASGPAALPVAIAADAQPYNVVLIGWDGVQREHLQQCLKRTELPNLAALGQAGALVDIDVTEVTDTKAGWAQILTGYAAAVTGVYNNGRYQSVPAGYTLFERAEQHFGPENVATLAVIGKDEHVGNNPPEKILLGPAGKLPAAGIKSGAGARKAWRQKMRQGQVVEEEGAKYLLVPGKPYYITQNAMDLFQNGLHENAKVGERALEVLRENAGRRFIYFIHFADVDSKGHRYGENSYEYNAAIVDCDRWLGRIEQELAALGLAEKTAVYVTADHGFDEGLRTHKAAPYVFLSTNDKAVTHGGTRADVAPTIMQRLGIGLAALEPPLTGGPLL